MKKFILSLLVMLCATAASAQTTYQEDTQSVDKEQLFMIGVRRCDTTPSSSSGTPGDRSSLCVDATGRLFINAALYGTDGTALVQDTLVIWGGPGTWTAGSAPTGGFGTWCRVGAAPPSTSGVIDDDTIIPWCSGSGAFHIIIGNDPCSDVAKTTTPISLITDTIIIPAVSGKKNYICAISVVAGAAEIVSITEGTTALCASGEVALLGSVTDAEGMSFAANGGLALIGGNATVIAGKTSNVNTCLNVSGSNRVSGYVTWVQAP